MVMEMDGVLLINKPQGKTSHDLVDFVRRKFKFKKVGHCGTLDPMATGLLMLVLGKATKIQDLLMNEEKVYAGTMKLGQCTDSQDADGQITEEKPVPAITQEEFLKVMQEFSGDFYQTPPMYSAVKIDGVPLYKLARAGKEVEREPRLVHIFHHKITQWNPPSISFEILCSKGFYVRTYCHDIGQKIGCGAHLTQLCRIKSGNFSLDRALSWEKLETLQTIDDLREHILSLPEVSQMRRQ
ncbi:MAG: tRNA pseudouridine(55) synthase TruB [Verrucomicrobiota bacterium]